MVILGTQRGTRKRFDRGAMLFWGVEIQQIVIFGVAQNWGCFGGIEK